MRIQNLNEQCIECIPYKTVSPGCKIVNSELPIIVGEITGLPPDIHAIVVTSDLQGIVIKDNKEILLGEEVAETLPLFFEIELGINPQNTIVALCGDFYASLEKRGGLGDVRNIWDRFNTNFKWVAGIAGNHDCFGDKSAFEEFIKTYGILFLEKEFKQIENMKIAGLSGIIGKPDRINRLDKDHYLSILQRLLLKNPDILILHQTPKYPMNNLEGDENITRIIEASNPVIVFCGHYHWSKPLVELKNTTQILNVDSRVVILKNNTI
ncbi:MAG TPA: metallophosphoesterase [Clostridia bacterium]